MSVSLGDCILDYCAGNGGKSLAMWSMSMGKASITVYDRDKNRLNSLMRRAELYGANVKVLERPCGAGKNEPSELFDVVLVDAPCTGTGAVRRNPEAKYVDGPGTYPEVQLAILDEAKSFVARNGCLIYTVCSVLEAETSEVIERFMNVSDSFELVNHEHNEFEFVYRNGVYLTIPEADPMFIAVLKKR